MHITYLNYFLKKVKWLVTEVNYVKKCIMEIEVQQIHTMLKNLFLKFVIEFIFKKKTSSHYKFII